MQKRRDRDIGQESVVKAAVEASLDGAHVWRRQRWPEAGDDHWLESISKSRIVLEEAGVNLRELELDALPG